MRKFLFGLPLVLACNPTPDNGSDGGNDGGLPNTCPAHTGAGTKHSGDITADQTWAEADSPHVITSSLSIAKGATLTIAPCAEVRIQATGVTVNGKLVANGTPVQPILITADDPTKPFTYIRSFGSIDLANVGIFHGGANTDPNGLGSIDVRADAAMPPAQVARLKNVVIDGSDQWGISLRANALLTDDSAGIVVKNAALGPVRAEAPSAGSVPVGQYTGNGVDEILVIANNPILQDATWHAVGVPFRIGDTKGNGNDMRVGGTAANSPVATLTIEDGATVRVSKGGRILMNNASSMSTGALVAKNVTFTSAEAAPAAGDWVGIYFGAAPLAQNKLDGVHVEYAGGPSFAKSYHCDLQGGFNEAEDAAIIMLGEPASEFITNSTIKASAGYGIDRGWHGAPLDFVATNTFDAIAKCKQSYPRDANGNCPMSIPCP